MASRRGSPSRADRCSTCASSASPSRRASRRDSTWTSWAGPARPQEVERLLGLGARHLDIGQGDVPWVVLADPEGNPCCVMEDRAAYADTGPLAALPLDSADPDRDAEFWSWLTGWTDAAGVAPRSLRHPSLLGPLLELCPEPSPQGDDQEPAAPRHPARDRRRPRRRRGRHRRARRPRAPPGVGRAAVAALRRPVRQRVLRASSAVVRTGHGAGHAGVRVVTRCPPVPDTLAAATSASMIRKTTSDRHRSTQRVHRRYGWRRFSSCRPAELFGRIVRVHR